MGPGRRGTRLNPPGRFERLALEPDPAEDDGRTPTEYFRDRSRSVITRNESPDVDLLGQLADHGAAHVWMTIPTLDETLRRRLEPRAATADARFDAVARLAARRVPAGVMVAPVIPGLTDHEIPAILARAWSAGASFASYQVLRLPGRVEELFDAWLDEHLPAQRAKILGRVRHLHGGCAGGGAFGLRFRGEGPVADVLEQLFRRSRERLALPEYPPPLSSSAFRRPARRAPLFDLA